MTRVIVCGAAGRMGKRLSALTLESNDLELAGGTEAPGAPGVGQDIGTSAGVKEVGIRIVGDLRTILSHGDVVVDFTVPEATLQHAELAAEGGKALVVGTTGLSPDQLTRFRKLVASIPCVFAPNYSIGVNLLFRLAKETASTLGQGYDVEITEAHHRFKKDAPSGTAKRLAQAVAEGLARDLDQVAIYGRKGITGQRTDQEIGIHAVRAGDIVGDHTVLFGGVGERIELTHRAQSRDTFAMGALRAVRFVAKAPPGLYDMQDVLGLS
jgi:4-hydroxy-tetrahydrodipicolinate reductase